MQVLANFQDTLKVLLGAFLTILGIVVTSFLQNRSQKKRMREEMLLRAMQLALSAGTFTRNLVYTKPEGISAIAKLPDNPADQLMAITMVHFPTAIRFSNRLHLQQQKIYSMSTDEPNSAEQLLKVLDEIASTATEILVELRTIAQREGMGGKYAKTITKGIGDESMKRILGENAKEQ